MNEQPPRHGPIAWVKRHPIAMILLTIIVIAFAAVIRADQSAGHALEQQIASIRANGEPMSVSDLRSLNSPITTEENLAPAIIDAVQPYLTLTAPAEMNRCLLEMGNARADATGQAASTEQVEAAEWYFAQFPDAMRSLHRACERTTGWCSLIWQSPLINMNLDGPTQIRTAGKILSLEALLAAEKGDAKQAGDSVLACYRCAHAFDENTYLPVIVSLLRIGIVGNAQNRMERVINRCGLDTETLIRLQAQTTHWCRPVGLPETMAVERVWFMDLYASLQGGSAQNTSPIYRFVPVLRYSEARFSIQAYSDAIAALREPDDGSVAAFDKWSSELDIPQYCIFSRMTLPSTSDFVKLHFRLAAQSRALIAAIACERFRLSTGHWPKTLDALVPEYLDEVPIDLFDGKPIRFAIIPEGIKVWSISDDRIDDGGDVMRLRARTSTNQRIPKDIGWVILNPNRRGAAAD